MEDNTKFIEALELAAPYTTTEFKAYSAFETTVSEPNFLNFKSINSFSSNVSPQAQEDVLNSMLLAQRAASKDYPEEGDILNWYGKYFEVLKKLGWLVTQQDFSRYSKKSNDAELNTVILELLADYLTGQQINLVNKALTLVKGLGDDDDRLIVFNRNTQINETGNFQLGLAEEENGNVSVLGFGFLLQSEKKITKILFLNFKKDQLNMKFNFYRAALVPGEYNKYRNLVKSKLGDSSSYIASLDI